MIEKHRHAGVFVLKGKQDAIVTLNLVPGDSVYGEKRVVQEVSASAFFFFLFFFFCNRFPDARSDARGQQAQD